MISVEDARTEMEILLDETRFESVQKYATSLSPEETHKVLEALHAEDPWRTELPDWTVIKMHSGDVFTVTDSIRTIRAKSA